jgi:hypothetical protein
MKTRRWAPEAISVWRPDRTTAAEVERDVDRIVGVAAAAGYALPRADAELVWLAHSAERCATWLNLENSTDETLLQTIGRYTRIP